MTQTSKNIFEEIGFSGEESENLRGCLKSFICAIVGDESP
jgi:hypothetical protein